MNRSLLALSLLLILPAGASQAQERGEARQQLDRGVEARQDPSPVDAQREPNRCDATIRFDAEPVEGEGEEAEDMIRVPTIWHVLAESRRVESGESGALDEAVERQFATLDRDRDGAFSGEELRAAGAETERTVSVPFTLQSDEYCP